jgi:hypothetical protein
MMDVCHGNGMCFTRGVACPNATPCTQTPCVNFKFCGSRMPEWICYASGDMCTGCDSRLGVLDIFQASDTTDECPICYENAINRVRMTCGNTMHNICVACFRKPDSLYFPHLCPQSFGCVYPHSVDTKLRKQMAANTQAFNDWRGMYPIEYSLYTDAVDYVEKEHGKRYDMLVDSLCRCPLCRGGSPWDGARLGKCV